jgi:hypothetical protein
MQIALWILLIAAIGVLVALWLKLRRLKVLLSKRIKDIDHQRQVADRKIEQLELDSTRFF